GELMRAFDRRSRRDVSPTKSCRRFCVAIAIRRCLRLPSGYDPCLSLMTRPSDSPPSHATNLHESEPRAEIETADVVVIEGVDQGARVTIPASGLRIGTAAGNELRLHDPTVSRIHCELRLKRGSVELIDPGSTNGCIANSVRVRDADLQPGATVRLG